MLLRESIDQNLKFKFTGSPGMHHICIFFLASFILIKKLFIVDVVHVDLVLTHGSV